MLFNDIKTLSRERIHIHICISSVRVNAFVMLTLFLVIRIFPFFWELIQCRKGKLIKKIEKSCTNAKDYSPVLNHRHLWRNCMENSDLKCSTLRQRFSNHDNTKEKSNKLHIVMCSVISSKHCVSSQMWRLRWRLFFLSFFKYIWLYRSFHLNKDFFLKFLWEKSFLIYFSIFFFFCVMWCSHADRMNFCRSIL